MGSSLPIERLRDPSQFLPAFGRVLDQRTSEIVKYDPARFAPELQYGILGFAANPPRTPEGLKKWLLVLASRQAGKSLTTALSLYVRTAFHKGVYSAVIADKKERSEDLFRYILTCHRNIPEAVRAPTLRTTEQRQITFEHGGKIRTLSGGEGAVGIGRAADNLQISEAPFWENMARSWNGIYPSVANRAEAGVFVESTPAPMSEPSADWYKDTCAEARKSVGRWHFVFSPFFASRLNERLWRPGDPLEPDEVEIMSAFGPKHGEPESAPGETAYLTLENIAFRREAMLMDVQIRRDPKLFKVFYPTDPLTCWTHAGGSAIPEHALERHLNAPLVPWEDNTEAQTYKDPDPAAIYVVAVDPAGWMGGDQASYQVLEVWLDRWEQVETASTNARDPTEFARMVLEAAERWNNAEVIVENNGVGLGVLSLLVLATRPSGVTLASATGKERAYHLRKLYFHTSGDRPGVAPKPGIPSSTKTNAEALAILIDALLDRLVLHDAETVDQLSSYRRDKDIQPGTAWNIVNPGETMKKRRARHHWDRVSALLWACYLATRVPQRLRPKTPEELAEEVLKQAEEDKKGLTLNQTRAIEARQRRHQRAQRRAQRVAGRAAGQGRMR